MSHNIQAARHFLATETTIGKRVYLWSGIEVRLWLAANYDGGFDQLMCDLKGRQ